MTDPPAYYIGGEVVIALASVFGNVMVVWAVKINRCLRDTTFYYVVSLALADIAVGALAIPLAIMISTGIQARFYGCLMSACIMLVLTQSSILALLAIAIDRYLRVKIPLSYKRMVTAKRAGGSVIACWLVAIIVGLTPIFGWNNLMDHNQTNDSQELNPIINCTFVSVISMEYMVYFNFFGCVLAPLVLMFVIYIEIFYMIHKQLNKKFNKAASQADPGRYYGKELKLAKSLALVLFLFAVSWLPLHILNCISLFETSSKSEAESGSIHLFNAILLSHGNSAVNPVVYAFRIKKFRTAFIKIWKQYVCCKKVNQWANKATRRRENQEQMMRRSTDI